ncbi:glycoside hydrolase family 2 [Sphingomonas sp. R-74633]|uniref:glycoside hydrolase family 2 n=1 Tax=Sphingomonas sp. R-74633 TaxID=2751188 RepID=UPI0015D360C1|nr:glycoside hydrolase family 2 [Sphingomonas sp. R-74633]NYT42968.1 glycoside hydrolase family 2 [Sphingomonas sp. R-74633]
MRMAIDTTQRRLLLGILLATVLTLALLIADLARGGRADPPALRAAATLLDGSWRFRTGDDPRWADPRTGDGGWGTIDLTARPGSHDGDVGLPDYVGGWMTQGHAGYSGHAWYRRAVDVPAGGASWDILGPTLVEDGYELYWNGQLLGGSGRIGEHPRVVGTRPLRFALPAGAAGTRGVLAIRTFMLPRPGPGGDAGGLHAAPILAPRPVADGLHRAQWERTIAGYVVDAVEPLAMLALVGLILWCRPRSSQRGFLAFAGIALALMAARRFNNALVAWTDMMDLPTYSLLAKYMWMPMVTAWALAWNRWHKPAWRILDGAALAILAAQVAGATAHLASLASISRWGSIALFVLIGTRIVRGGPMRVLAPIALALITVCFFGDELLDPIGVPGIWFPFGIGVSRTQYLYAALIPLLAVLVVRTLDGPDRAAVRA